MVSMEKLGRNIRHDTLRSSPFVNWNILVILSNTISADVLVVPGVAKSSATTKLTTCGKQVLAFHKSGFQLALFHTLMNEKMLIYFYVYSEQISRQNKCHTVKPSHDSAIV